MRQSVVSILKQISGFHSLTEEYPVLNSTSGGVIDIVAKLSKRNRIFYFIIECKDYRDTEIVFPKSSINDTDLFDWALHYNFIGRSDVHRHSVKQLLSRDTYYATDICCKSLKNKGKAYDYDQFYKWSVQASSNFMAFAIEENKTRTKLPGEMEDFFIFPLLVCRSKMSSKESIIINPHPFTEEHLSIITGDYIEPIERGELKKHAFILTQEKHLSETIKKIMSEI